MAALGFQSEPVDVPGGRAAAFDDRRGTSSFGMGVDFGVMALALGVMVAIATRLHPTIIS